MKKHTSKKRHNYIRPLLELATEHPTPGVYHVTVLHDDACAYWRGGYCDCQPEVRKEGKS